MDHAQVILSGILPHDKDKLLIATAQLEPAYFKGSVQRIIFEMMTRYFDQTGGMLTRAALTELLSRSPIEAGKIVLFEEIFDAAVHTPISDHEFKFSIQCLRDDYDGQKTGEMITEAYAILEAVNGSEAVEVNGKKLAGHRDAKQFLYERLGEIDKLSGLTASAPEGDMMIEGDDLLAEYYKRKSGEIEPGIPLGIPQIDSHTGGLANGEVALIAAFTNEGKSQFCSQVAWNSAVTHGKNVYYATTETQRSTIIRRIVARHSRLPMFGYPKGLDSNAIKMGTLTPEEEMILKAVLDDLKNNKAYGKIDVGQIPRGATMSYVEARMKRAHQQWEVQFGIWDSLNLLKPDVRRNSEREELNDMLRDWKTISTSFNDGKGIPMLSPWQMSRDAWQTAQQVGMYQMASLSDTSEAEKTPDMVMTLLRFADSPKKARFQTLKMRDSEIPPIIELDVDYRCAFLGQASGDAFSSLPDFNFAGQGAGF